MAKKQVLVGAPAYMAQYTALMTILLAFFILMNTLASEEQESGFQAGIGEVKNAFGAMGGMGFFQYMVWGEGGKHSPNPQKQGDKQGISRDLIERDGGTGITDLNQLESDQGKFVRIRVPARFYPRKITLNRAQQEYLKKVGLGFALYDFTIDITCYSTEVKERGGNIDRESCRKLALMRAVKIMDFLHSKCGVDYSRMRATGSSYAKYFEEEDQKTKMPSQGTFFYVFVKGEKP